MNALANRVKKLEKVSMCLGEVYFYQWQDVTENNARFAEVDDESIPRKEGESFPDFTSRVLGICKERGASSAWLR